MDLTANGHGPVVGSKPPDQAKPLALVGVIWMLLVINTLGSGGEDTIIPLPTTVAQLITMGSLGVAFALALVLNPGLRIRPSGFLLLMTLLLVVGVISSVLLDPGVGAMARCARLTVFIATLWLLSAWWDTPLSFVRNHIRALGVILTTVVLGLVIAPGLAMSEDYGGRLIGAVWYLPPPQVAHFAGAAAGLTLMLWLARSVDGRSVILIALPAIVLLLLTHTRTATIGLIAGLALAGSSLFLNSARARRIGTGAVLTGGLIILAFGPALLSWFRRGQGEDALQNLTGRQQVWDALLTEPRTTAQQLFGIGLTDKSFDGLPIDSGWLAVYHEQGLVGVVIVVAFLAGLVIVAARRPPSTARACAIFLIVYCLVSSYTEVGLGDASLYLLELSVAAACLSEHRRDRAEQSHSYQPSGE